MQRRGFIASLVSGIACLVAGRASQKPPPLTLEAVGLDIEGVIKPVNEITARRPFPNLKEWADELKSLFAQLSTLHNLPAGKFEAMCVKVSPEEVFFDRKRRVLEKFQRVYLALKQLNPGAPIGMFVTEAKPATTDCVLEVRFAVASNCIWTFGVFNG